MARLRHLEAADIPADPDEIARKGETRVRHRIRLVEALAAVPGVEAVGFANQTPLNGCCLSTALYPDASAIDLTAPQKVAFLPISPGYVQALGVPLRRGRLLTEADTSDAVVFMVINQAAASRRIGRTGIRSMHLRAESTGQTVIAFQVHRCGRRRPQRRPRESPSCPSLHAELVPADQPDEFRRPI